MKLDATVLTWFGETDSTEQAIFLNRMAGALLLACGRNLSKEETQLCYVAERLDIHGQRFVKQLAAFVDLRGEQGPIARPDTDAA